MTVTERCEATARAKKALRLLEEHNETTLGQLGAARDQLNIVQNSTSRWEVEDAVFAIECIVLNVYGGVPTEA